MKINKDTQKPQLSIGNPNSDSTIKRKKKKKRPKNKNKKNFPVENVEEIAIFSSSRNKPSDSAGTDAPISSRLLLKNTKKDKAQLRKQRRLDKQKKSSLKTNDSADSAEEEELITVDSDSVEELEVERVADSEKMASVAADEEDLLGSEEVESDIEASSFLTDTLSKAKLTDEEGEELEGLENLDDSEGSDVTSSSSQPQSEEFVQFCDGVFYKRYRDEKVGLLLLIEDGKRVYFKGKAVAQLVQGQVEMYGYRWRKKNEAFKIFGPCKGHSSLVFIEGKGEDGEEVEMEESEEEEVDPELAAIPQGFAALILRGFENNWTAGLRSTAVDGYSLIGPEISLVERNTSEDFQKKLPQMRDFLDKFGFQLVSPEDEREGRRLLTVNPEWDTFFNRILEQRRNEGGFGSPERICNLGGKGVGKSTFGRWLINRILSSGSNEKVLYLDFDPGQTEFNPPGMLAVHVVSEPVFGPNFSHLKHPEKAVFLGGVNVADFPVSYVEAVIELVRFASENYSDIPWIINTMGFCTGLGVPLNISVIQCCKPSFLAQLSIASDPRRSFPLDLVPSSVSSYPLPLYFSPSLGASTESRQLHYEFCKIESVFGGERDDPAASAMQSARPRSRNPKHRGDQGESPKSLRDSMLISYFSETIGSTPDHSLLSFSHVRLNLNTTTIGVMSIQSDFRGTLNTLTNNLVALCKISEPVSCKIQPAQQGYQAQDPLRTNTYISDVSPFLNEFIGYAICKHYQNSSNELVLVTPIPEENLSSVNIVICAGQVGVPVTLFVSNSRNLKPGQHSHMYVSGAQGQSGRRHYVPGRKSTHVVLKKCLL